MRGMAGQWRCWTPRLCQRVGEVGKFFREAHNQEVVVRYLQGRHCASTPLSPFFSDMWMHRRPHKKNGTMHRQDQHHVCIRKRNQTRLGERQHPQSHAGQDACGFVLCPSVRKASMTCDSDLESLSSWTGSSRVASSSFLPRNLPPCFDSSSTSHIFLPTGCVLRGVNFGLFAFRDEVAVCPF